ncbi:MAG TPA: NADH:flavin oxidoreductase [Planctomycetaceae bacterium]|nr:NADH:flavin oxidoreductase [Planctomycetaceae bacterium]
MAAFSKIAQLARPEAFQDYLRANGIGLPFLSELPEPAALNLARPLSYRDRTIGNRWAILPMEGWDCEPNGAPSELTRRRWLRFAKSGAKLLFGCEAAAVMESGRGNTRQLTICDRTVEATAALHAEMVRTHEETFGRRDDLYVGLQLTHSGRFSHPHDDTKLESVIAYRNPWLDKKFGNQDTPVASDAQIDEMIGHFIHAGELAARAGFDFVDIKHAHGYFGHELLSAYDRPGKYGGSLENRSRFFLDIAQGIRKAAPGLDISLRFSLFDVVPYVKGPDGVGTPITDGNYPYAFGGDGTSSGSGYDLSEPFEFIERIVKEADVRMVCATVGSPYYNPHLQRPAAFPVFDGYAMPFDPLKSVAMHIAAAAEFKRRFPDLLIVGSGYTYLQDWLPNVAEAVLAAGMIDSVGIGRMVLSYPELCDDILKGRPVQRKRICRTLGDCTNAPRNGMVSGCYPLDAFYKTRPEARELRSVHASHRLD